MEDTDGFLETKYAIFSDAMNCNCNIALRISLRYSHNWSDLGMTLHQATGVGAEWLVEKWGKYVKSVGSKADIKQNG